MTYTLGVIENALKQIKDRLDAHRVAGERLVDIKSVLIGRRPISDGNAQFPRIFIFPTGFTEKTKTMANAASEKEGKLSVLISVVAEKISSTTAAQHANNVLFDSAGKGIIAYLQWVLDALTLTAADVYNPTLTLRLDTIPDISLATNESATWFEALLSVDFTLRYQMGHLGGTLTA